MRDGLFLLAAAVFINLEELLHLLSDEGESGVDKRLLPAGPIVVAENNYLLVLHVLGEHRINEENRGLEFLVLGVDRLEISGAKTEGFDIGHPGKDWVAFRSSSAPLGTRNELITLTQFSLSNL